MKGVRLIEEAPGVDFVVSGIIFRTVLGLINKLLGFKPTLCSSRG